MKKTHVPRDPRPDWSREPFHRFYDYVETEWRLLHLTIFGISGLVARERMVEILYDPSYPSYPTDIPEAEVESQLNEARASGELARAEMDADFPLLHAHSLISVWGALEAMVNDVVRTWIRHRPSLLGGEAFAGVKVPLAEFHRMKSAERVESLLEQVRPQGTGGGFQTLEAWLAKVELDGPLDEKLRRSLIEAWEVRNVYAHRGGLADKKARDNCPWRRRDWKLGKQIRVSHAEYGRYTDAIREYVHEILVRSSQKFGLDAQEYERTVSRLLREGKIEYTEDGRRLRDRTPPAEEEPPAGQSRSTATPKPKP